MRDKIIALAMCALLAVSLFACGESRGIANDSDVLGDEQHYGSESSKGNNTTDKRSDNNTTGKNSGGSDTDRRITTGNNAKQSDVMGDSALRNGSTFNPANGGADRTATWEQMLQNGRVHDRDGFLLDGENSHWA